MNDEIMKELERFFKDNIQSVPDNFKNLIVKNQVTDKKMSLVAKAKYSGFGNFKGYEIEVKEINNVIFDLNPGEFILMELFDLDKFDQIIINDLINIKNQNQRIDWTLDELIAWLKDNNYYNDYLYTLIAKRIGDNLNFHLAQSFEGSDELSVVKLINQNQTIIEYGVYFDLQ